MQTETKTFDVQAAIAAQKKLQQEKGYPDFAPHNGVCYKCHGQIYEERHTKGCPHGISVESASAHLVTGCPHCYYSYCE
jgi:hypothetical protein